MSDVLDIAVIGSGPAGLCTAEAALAQGQSVRVFEKGCLAQSIYAYPTFMLFHSTGENLELGGLPLVCRGEKPTRQEYLEYLRRYVETKGIEVNLYTEVMEVTGEVGNFTLRLRDRHGEETTQRARFVVIGTGGYESPQPLGCSGDDLPKVKPYFDEVHPYWNQDVVVVGGGNSSVETALLLARAGVRVTIVHRKPDFAKAKYWLTPDIENRIKEGRIRALRPAKVSKVTPRHIEVEMLETGETERLPNDWVLALTGFQPNRKFLSRCGITLSATTKQPSVDPASLESNVPGIFCAGVIMGGSISGMIFIENARFHGEVIMEGVKTHLRRMENC